MINYKYKGIEVDIRKVDETMTWTANIRGYLCGNSVPLKGRFTPTEIGKTLGFVEMEFEEDESKQICIRALKNDFERTVDRMVG